jgi:hypothetical protein
VTASQFWAFIGGAVEAWPLGCGVTRRPSPRPGVRPEHHILTNKNTVSTASGGPWTPKFEAIAKRAGYTLKDSLNLIRVKDHHGPHPELYHRTIFARLVIAMKNKTGKAATEAFEKEMGAIRNELAKPGTELNRLITGK